MYKKHFAFASLSILLGNQFGHMNFFGPRYPVMSPEGGEGGAGGAGGEGGSGGGEGGAAPTVEQQLKSVQDQLLQMGQQNAELKSKLESGNKNQLNDQIKNETDPTKLTKLLKESLEAQQEQNKQLKKSIMANNIKSALLDVAGDRVHDVADVLNQPEFRDVLKSGFNQETMELDRTIAKAAVDKLLEKKPYLAKQVNSPGTVNNKPGQVSKGKAVSEMTEAEIMAELKKVW